MFTLSSKSEMTNVTGVMIPCHSPSQKPAGSPAPEAATSFAPGAQAARTRPPTATPSASSAVLNRLMTPPSILGPKVAPAGAEAGGWPSSSRAPLSHPLDLPLDLLLAERLPEDLHHVAAVTDQMDTMVSRVRTWATECRCLAAPEQTRAFHRSRRRAMVSILVIVQDAPGAVMGAARGRTRGGRRGRA